MESIVRTSIFALAILFVTAYVSDLVFKIYSDKYYRIFHLLGGGFSFLLVYGLTSLAYLSFFLVLIIGLLWELHEWLMWKYVWKKKVLKPRKKDTLDDLMMDMLGAAAFYLSSIFFNY